VRMPTASVLVWPVIALLMVSSAEGNAQVDPLSLVAKSFLQSLLKQLFTIEDLEGMGPIEGHRTVDQAYERAKAETDRYFAGERDRLTKQCEARLRGQDLVHPSLQTRQIIESYDRRIDSILAKWSQALKGLERQRAQIVEAFSPYWKKHPEKLQQTM
jgi:hypothetical protein